jgi:hypothetical protein
LTLDEGFPPTRATLFRSFYLSRLPGTTPLAPSLRAMALLVVDNQTSPALKLVPRGGFKPPCARARPLYRRVVLSFTHRGVGKARLERATLRASTGCSTVGATSPKSARPGLEPGAIRLTSVRTTSCATEQSSPPCPFRVAIRTNQITLGQFFDQPRLANKRRGCGRQHKFFHAADVIELHHIVGKRMVAIRARLFFQLPNKHLEARPIRLNVFSVFRRCPIHKIGPEGFEPSTPPLSTKRSAVELRAINSGSGGRRSRDLPVKSRMLCRLSYGPVGKGGIEPPSTRLENGHPIRWMTSPTQMVEIERFALSISACRAEVILFHHIPGAGRRNRTIITTLRRGRSAN